MTRFLLVTALMSVGVPSAVAQTTPQLEAPTQASVTATSPVRLFEFGGGLSAGVSEGVALLPSAGVRLNLTSATSVEVVAHVSSARYGVVGVYVVDVRQALGSRTRRIVPFVMAGFAGEFRERFGVETSQYQKTTGETLVYPAYDYWEVSKPSGLACGGGVRVRLGSHVAFDSAAQLLLGEGVLLTAGVTVSFGPRR